MKWQMVVACAATATLLSGCVGTSSTQTTGGESQAAPSSTSATTSASAPATSDQAQAPATERRDIDAVGDGATEHKLDLFLPTGQGNGPFPLVIWVHGGGWKGGDKSDILRAEDIQMIQTTNLLREKGYAVASPNYRLMPNAKFPEPMQDVAASVRYLRTHADELGVDPDKFALMGDSAGAHLASMTAFAQDRKDLQGNLGGETEQASDSHVKAFVGYYGIYDLTQRTSDQQQICGGGKGGMESSHGRLIGVDPDSAEGRETALAASPVSYAAATSPATLLFSGREDCTAPYPQAERFAKAIQDAGGTAELTIIDRSHGDPQFFTDPAIHEQLITFLDTHVKN